MTTIPEHEYHLGFESELKLDLNKYTLSSDDVGQIDFDEIYNKLVSKYKKYEAPLNWIEKWG